MAEILQKGGPVMWVLLALSVTGVAVFLERVVYLHRATTRVDRMLRGLANLVAIGHFEEALEECGSTPGPAARVMRAVLARHDLSRTELRELAQDTGQLEVPKLERNLGMLASIVYLAPLIGLFGAAVGLVQTFSILSAQGGYATTAEISGGIYQSLLATAAGLAVAIPALLAHQFLSGRVGVIVQDIERAGIEIVNLVTEAHRAAGRRTPKQEP